VAAEIRYARNGGVAIAYQVAGGGETDRVYVRVYLASPAEDVVEAHERKPGRGGDTCACAPFHGEEVTRHVVRGLYVVVAVVVCPLLAWNLAVAAADHGFGGRAFFLVLLAVPVTGAGLAAALLRRRGREATFGAVGALGATLLLVIVLVIVALSHGGFVTP
jgi:hypothetical protein